MAPRAVALLLLVAGTGTCATREAGAPPRSIDDVAEAQLLAAEDLEAQGDYARAIRHLKMALPSVPPDYAAQLQLNICSLEQRLRGPGAARACYLPLRHLSERQWASLARYRAAELLLANDPAGGAEELRDLLVSQPGSEGASRALVLWRRLRRGADGVSGELEALMGVAGEIEQQGGDALADEARALPWRSFVAQLRVEAATLCAEELSDPARAEALFAQARAQAQGSEWWDDATVGYARVLRQRGRYAEAVSLYDELIDAQESSWIVGSYYSIYFGDALLERGQAYEEMGDLRAAERAYRQLRQRLPTSVLVDDAEFHAARLAERHGGPGALEDFIDDYPESAYVKQARAILEGRRGP